MTAHERLYPHPCSVGVVGAGLIGGSIVRRCQTAAIDVTVYEQDATIAAAVREAGITTVESLEELVDGSDLVVVAVPPSATIGIWKALADIAPRRRDDRTGRLVVIDVASAKAPLVTALTHESDWANSSAVFVLTHPMAGREVSGWQASQETLFDQAAWIVCPNQSMSGYELVSAVSFVRMMGARACFMSTDFHDRFAAMTSHLPHLVAFAYRDLLEVVDPNGTWWRFGGGSLADLLRVADADPQLWRDILSSNEAELVSAADALIARINLGWPAPLAAADDVGTESGVLQTIDIVSPERPVPPAQLEALWESGKHGLEVVSLTTNSTVVIELDRRGESPIRHQRRPQQR